MQTFYVLAMNEKIIICFKLFYTGMNVLCGVGILSTPSAVKEGGWVGLSILVIFAILSYYTGILLRSCLDSQPGLETYPDIGQAAFGTGGRIVISVSIFYLLVSFHFLIVLLKDSKYKKFSYLKIR